MTFSIPDPYTTSLAVAMYYQPPIRYDRTELVCIIKKEEEKKPRKKVQPAGNIGSNVDTYA